VSPPPNPFLLPQYIRQSTVQLTFPSLCNAAVAALVIDNGSGMCKAGFAGDDAPRAVFP
jgi:hypothetical protein